jgi:hypothetical protein
MGISSRQINAELARTFARSTVANNYERRGHEAAEPYLGEGFYARAQQEVLEVLLNQSELFNTVKKRLSLDSFDVPIFRQIAEALFESLEGNPKAGLRDVLSRVESVETANVITDLAADGEKKGNFSTRLTKALDAMQEHQEIRGKTRIRTIDGSATTDKEAESLRRLKSKLERPNLRNAGMV